jgi:hypothetical protein
MSKECQLRTSDSVSAAPRFVSGVGIGLSELIDEALDFAGPRISFALWTGPFAFVLNFDAMNILEVKF